MKRVAFDRSETATSVNTIRARGSSSAFGRGEERGHRPPLGSGPECFGHEVQRGSVLFARRVGDAHDALREQVPAFALRAEARFSPQNKAADLRLGVIVGRFDALFFDEGPQRLPVMKDVLARTGQAFEPQRRRLLKFGFEVAANGTDPLSQLGPRQLSVLVRVPVFENEPRVVEESLPMLCGRTVALRETNESADEMRVMPTSA